MLFRSNDTATTEIYTEENTLSLHDAHPIWASLPGSASGQPQTPLANLVQAYADAGGQFA